VGEWRKKNVDLSGSGRSSRECHRQSTRKRTRLGLEGPEMPGRKRAAETGSRALREGGGVSSRNYSQNDAI